MAALRPEMERIIGDAVRIALGIKPLPNSHIERFPRCRAVSLPIALRCNDDAARLVQWFKAVCASDQLRQRFLDGSLTLDIQLGPTAQLTEKSVGVADTVEPIIGCKNFEASVITEAVLRREAKRGQHLLLTAAAVITPSARDYARSMDIRLERSKT